MPSTDKAGGAEDNLTMELSQTDLKSFRRPYDLDLPIMYETQSTWQGVWKQLKMTAVVLLAMMLFLGMVAVAGGDPSNVAI